MPKVEENKDLQKPKVKDRWDKADIIIKAMGSIGVVVLIFIISIFTTEQSKKAELNQKKLETAYKLIPDLLDSNVTKRHIALIGICNSLTNVDHILLFKILNEVIDSKSDDFDFRSRAYECLHELDPNFIERLQEKGNLIVNDSLFSISKRIQGDSTLSSSDFSNVEEVKKALNKRNIAYIQYNSNCKQKVEDISKQLSNNYIVPPIDGVAYNGENEIRYFNNEDQPYAQNLKNELEKIIGKIEIKFVPLIKTKVPLGQLEVWLNQDICK
ncbi:MAG: hypothetical protein ABI840_12935 [bacterium]